MYEVYYNRKFCVWNLNILQFKENLKFQQSIDKAFNNYNFNQKFPDSSNGLAYSITIYKNNVVENSFIDFDKFLEFINPSLELHLTNLCGTNQRKLISCWANMMHQNSYGTIHSHANADYVLLFYYKAPKDSSDLLFVNPKYKYKNITRNDTLQIPEEECFRLKVFEGMCVLHQGDMLHTVSLHNSCETREVIVLEYKVSK